MKWLLMASLVSGCVQPRGLVEIRDLRFEPADLVVNAGDTITWANRDIVAHTVTFDGGDTRDEVAAGGTLQIVVPLGDILAYRCRYHPSMRGRLMVAREN